MRNNNPKQKQVNWKKLGAELQQELDRVAIHQFQQEPKELTERDLATIKSLKQRLNREIYREIESRIEKVRQQVFSPLEKIKEIILNLEIVPFQFATRSADISESGKPWRHDGGAVKFKLRIPHDKLEIYSPRGEFLCSYPVQPNGEVQIDDLAAGVYLLYLRGRKIVDMELEEV